MTAHPYHRHLARILDRMGGAYLVSDILTAIAEGRMQSFIEGDSWAVTQIVDYPRTRMLDILVALGDYDECWKLHDRILDYARDHDIGLVQAYGRKGWMPEAATRGGWKVKTTSYLYQRTM
jgi:hypothetical protein